MIGAIVGLCSFMDEHGTQNYIPIFGAVTEHTENNQFDESREQSTECYQKLLANHKKHTRNKHYKLTMATVIAYKHTQTTFILTHTHIYIYTYTYYLYVYYTHTHTYIRSLVLSKYVNLYV